MSDLLGVLDSSPAGFDRGNCVVITTGGEPLVRKDIVQVGAQIKQRGYLWGMVTNGMLLTQDKVSELVETGLDTVAMSFDGFEPEHNWMRGSDQSFKRADAALDWFNEHPGLTWDVITCVNQRNFNYLNELKEYLISRGVKMWRIFTVAPMGRAVTEPDLMLSNEQFGQLMDFITMVRREGRIRLNFSCEGFVGRYEGLVRDHLFHCIAGVSVASINTFVGLYDKYYLNSLDRMVVVPDLYQEALLVNVSSRESLIETARKYSLSQEVVDKYIHCMDARSADPNVLIDEARGTYWHYLMAVKLNNNQQ